MIEIREARAEQIGWVEQKTDCVLTRNARAVVAMRGDEIVGMVAFDAWTGSAAQAHMAVTYPAVWRRLLRPAFDYVFRYAGKELLIGVIPGHNRASWQFVESVGFRRAYAIEDGWERGDPLLIFEMRKGECRFLKGAANG